MTIRIVVLGGGVGGTLVANLLARQLKAQIARSEATISLVDTTGRHVYQPGFMYLAVEGGDPAKLERSERSLLDKRIGLVQAEIGRVDEARSVVVLTDGRELPYDQLVIATGSRIVPEALPGFEAAHHFYTAEAALRLRTALDAFSGGKLVVAIGGMPYKCPPAPLEVTMLIEAELRRRGLREATELSYHSPIGRAFTIETVSDMVTPILAQKGIILETFSNVESIDPARRVMMTLEGLEFPFDLLICIPPHKGAQFLMDSGLAPAPGGWLATDRATLQVGDRPNVYALGDATDLPLSKAGSTAHFEAPIIAERIAATVQKRAPAGKHVRYAGKVMCFFEFGDNKGTLLSFNYENPPHPPAPSRLWHYAKLLFNRLYWVTVPKGRV